MSNMTKEQLMAKVKELEAKVNELESRIGGRKKQVYDYLMKHGPCRVSDIAAKLKISDRNVSSQMAYLRKEGVAIATNSRGYKFIEADG